MLRIRWYPIVVVATVAAVPASGLTAWALGGGVLHIALAAFGPIFISMIVARWRAKDVRPSGITVITFTAAAVVYGAFAWALGLFDRHWWLGLPVIILVVFPMRGFANTAMRAEVGRGQHLRNSAAAAIAQQVTVGAPTERFALYLRPFDTTDRLPTQPMNPSQLPTHQDFESRLERAFRGRCPIVALGDPYDIAEGPGRIVTPDDAWRPLMTALARRAAFIVMVPLARPSTQWELRWLSEHDLLGKVLMVMPETVGRTPNRVISATPESDRIIGGGLRYWNPRVNEFAALPMEWQRAVHAARDIRIELPPLAAAGALFTIDATSRRVGRIRPLMLSTIATPGEYLRDVITDLGLLGEDPRPSVDVESTLAHAVRFGGATREFALMRAADGFLAWGDGCTAARLLTSAVSASSAVPRFVPDYVGALPEITRVRWSGGDYAGALNYQAGTPVLLESPELVAIAGPELVKQVASAADDELGRLREELARRELVELHERVLGTDHPETLAARLEMVLHTARTEHAGTATAILRELLADQERVLGSGHPDTAVTREMLATALLAMGADEQAEETLREAVDATVTRRGIDHPETILIRFKMALLRYDGDRRGQSAAVLRALADELEQVLGTDDPDTRLARELVARIDSSTGERYGVSFMGLTIGND